MAARNAKRWILAIYILRKNRGLWTVEKNRNNQWLISQYLLEKTSSWRSWIFFLKASISFFISRLRLSIKYTNMRRAKTTEGKRSRKSSTVCLLVTYVDFSFLWLQPKQFNCLKNRKKPILAERWVNWYNNGKQLLQYSQTRILLTGVRRIAIVTCCARDQRASNLYGDM